MNSQKLLVVISGATGSGKTAISIPLAKYFNTAVVSADSRQFYREIPIGTAAPDKEELNTVPHFLIGQLSILDQYNVYAYEQDAISVLKELFELNDIVFLVGGSGMYIDAVCNGIDDIPDIDHEIRAFCNTKFKEEGIEALRFQLAKLDPISYHQIDLKNPKRIIRALEVCLSTGKPYSSFRTSTKKQRDFNILRCVITLNRSILYERINNRVDEMIIRGLEDEAKRYFHLRHINALNTVGYSELFDYFEGKQSRERAIDLIKRNSRRFAKRQLSWFGRDSSAFWFENPTTDKLITFISGHR